MGQYSPDLSAGNEAVSSLRSPLIIGQDDGDFDDSLRHLSLGGTSESSQIDTVGKRQRMLASNSSHPISNPVAAQPTYQNYVPNVSPLAYDPRFGIETGGNPYGVLPLGIPAFGMPLIPLPSYKPSVAEQHRAVPPFVRPRAGPVGHQQRLLQKQVPRQTNDYASGHHNVVDVERIRHGLDVRTTVRDPKCSILWRGHSLRSQIMLRNIPNKIDQVLFSNLQTGEAHAERELVYA